MGTLIANKGFANLERHCFRTRTTANQMTSLAFWMRRFLIGYWRQRFWRQNPVHWHQGNRISKWKVAWNFNGSSRLKHVSVVITIRWKLTITLYTCICVLSFLFILLYISYICFSAKIPWHWPISLFIFTYLPNVPVAGNGHVYMSSNPWQSCLRFT